MIAIDDSSVQLIIQILSFVRRSSLALTLPITDVTPIIQTHNTLTSHNQTHNNRLEPIKNGSIIMGSSPIM